MLEAKWTRENTGDVLPPRCKRLRQWYRASLYEAAGDGPGASQDRANKGALFICNATVKKKKGSLDTDRPSTL